MPVNSLQQQDVKIDPYRPSKADKDFLSRLKDRMDFLKDERKKLKANPYDEATNARTVEKLWDFCDFVALPHKYSHRELQPWMADNSRPLIYSKIDTALSIILAKNPEIELAARSSRYEKKTELLKALYNLSWDKGEGRQQLIRFVYNLAKYGTAIGREYHRYEESEIQEMQAYDPEKGEHILQTKTVIRHDEPFFEVLPIRDVWFDNHATPGDEETFRDWFFEKTYDYSTFLKKFPAKKYPNGKFVRPTYGASAQDTKDKADLKGDSGKGMQVRLRFYENKEDNEFVITDEGCRVLIYREPLFNNELSVVLANWRMRSDHCIYGVGLCEVLENSQELLDKVSNMTINQIMLSIGGSGFYGGSGTISQKEALLEPKLKKLKDADKIIFPKIPTPGMEVWRAIEDIRNEADDISGVTKSLEGDQVGKTLGEAVLNREAGLRRLSNPLENIQHALERQARLRIDSLQYIYSRPVKSTMIRDSVGNILDEKLWQEYQEEKQQVGADSIGLIQRFPEDELTGAVFRNQFKEERLPLEKGAKGEVMPSENDQWLEISPEEIRGEYDVRIRAMSTIPVSQALEETRTLETFQLIMPLPYTDIYKAQQNLLKKRGHNPDEWMKSKEEIMEQQQAAMGAAEMGMAGAEGMGEESSEQGQPQLQKTAIGGQFANAFGGL